MQFFTALLLYAISAVARTARSHLHSKAPNPRASDGHLPVLPDLSAIAVPVA
ncbi:MAG: hypothetical protein KME08_05950 [Aphanothece sp. CMT-3BRIN-NPC111]|nr:hypothetical protein [Aphanothece sp. CMT-3BRIN-NPC111]